MQSASIYNNTEDSDPTACERSLIGDNLLASINNTCKHIEVKLISVYVLIVTMFGYIDVPLMRRNERFIDKCVLMTIKLRYRIAAPTV